MFKLLSYNICQTRSRNDDSMVHAVVFFVARLKVSSQPSPILVPTGSSFGLVRRHTRDDIP